MKIKPKRRSRKSESRVTLREGWWNKIVDYCFSEHDKKVEEVDGFICETGKISVRTLRDAKGRQEKQFTEKSFAALAQRFQFSSQPFKAWLNGDSVEVRNSETPEAKREFPNVTTQNDRPHMSEGKPRTKSLGLDSQIPSSLVLTRQSGMPQGVDHLEVHVATGQIKVLTCKIMTDSEYFRFGFKLLTETGRLFGDLIILTPDKELVIHVGRNDSDRPKDGLTRRDIFITWYVDGRRTLEPRDRKLFSSDPSFIASVELRIESNIAYFVVDGTCYLKTTVSPEICKRAAIMAWGDKEDYEVQVSELSVTRISAL